MNIRFFGKLADSLGREVELPVSSACSVAELRELLQRAFPHSAKTLRGPVRACVGERFVADSHVVQPTDRVEFIPPVSGG
jgi:molybdopterin converting factor small subunit